MADTVDMAQANENVKGVTPPAIKATVVEVAEGEKARPKGTLVEKNLDLSIQRRAEIESPFPPGVATTWFFSATAEDRGVISDYWSEARDADLREFVWRDGNDILQGAVASIVKKFKAMAWSVEGSARPAIRGQKLLQEAEFGQGWETLLGKVVEDYLTQDKGAFMEVIGPGDPLGPILGVPTGLAHLDAGRCQLTGHPIYPVLFNNPKDNKPHKIHTSRVIHLVDLASPEEERLDIGFCAVSRVLSASRILLKVLKYKDEKLDDLPQAGLLTLQNIQPERFNEAKEDYESERRKLGQEMWANIMVLFSLDPEHPVKAEFTSFASLPDAFNERSTTELYVNILALAFGVDVREFWPMSAGPLGSGTETLVQHQKAKGKGIGELLSAVERAINLRVLPKVAKFKFDFRDDEEDAQRAQIDETKTRTIMSMFVPDPATGEAIVTREEIRQMLADNVSYFREEFLELDITDDIFAFDTERKSMLREILGPTVRAKSDGRVFMVGADPVHGLNRMIMGNYLRGDIGAKALAEYAVGEYIPDPLGWDDPRAGDEGPGHRPNDNVLGEKGSAKSGNWGHAGRPGKRGGSAPKAKGGGMGGIGRPFPEDIAADREFENAARSDNIIDEDYIGGGIVGAHLVEYGDDGKGIWKEGEVVGRPGGGHSGDSEVGFDRIDDALGYGICPKTVYHKKDGTYGTSQRYIEGAKDGYSSYGDSRLKTPENQARIEQMAVMDYITDNHDRHGGNWIVGGDGKVWAIDHGHTGWGYSGDKLAGRDTAADLLSNVSGAKYDQYGSVRTLTGFQLSESSMSGIRGLTRERFDAAVSGVGNYHFNADFAWGRIEEIQRTGRIDWSGTPSRVHG